MKNKKLILAITILLVVVIAIVLGYKLTKKDKNTLKSGEVDLKAVDHGYIVDEYNEKYKDSYIEDYDTYQKFIDDYKSNFALFLFLNINFPEVILQDSNFEENPELISKVFDAYDSMIQCADDSTELALIYQSTLKLNATKSEDIRAEEYSEKFFEYYENLPENLMDYRFENPILNPYKLALETM